MRSWPIGARRSCRRTRWRCAAPMPPCFVCAKCRPSPPPAEEIFGGAHEPMIPGSASASPAGRASPAASARTSAATTPSVGDTVNLASRIEAATRLYRTTNLICGRTAEAIRASFELREIDTVFLPGIDAPQTMFEIIGRAGQVSAEQQELRASYELALGAYRRGDWPVGAPPLLGLSSHLARGRTDADHAAADREAGRDAGNGRPAGAASGGSGRTRWSSGSSLTKDSRWLRSVR